MAKIVLNDVTNSADLSAINSNFDEIADALNNGALWRDNPVGEPNQMTGNLDMNGHLIINAGAIVPSIGDGSIQTSMLADGAVTTPKLADANVTSPKLADNSVIPSKIPDSSLTSAKYAPLSVNTTALADGAATLAKLAANSVDGSKIVNGAVTSSKLATASVGDSQLVWPGLCKMVTTVANIRALDKTRYTVAGTLCYTSLGDGGSGFYFLNAGDTTSADNGGSIIVASDGGRWYLYSPTTINVKQWGARGDGSTNDYTAFQNAINYAQSQINAEIVIPRGVFIIGQKLQYTAQSTRSSIHFRGAGADITEVRFTSLDGGFRLSLTSPGHTFHFKDMSITTAQGAGSGYGIYAVQTMSLNQFLQNDISHVTFRGADNAGSGGSFYWDNAYFMDGVCGTNVYGVTVYGSGASGTGGYYRGNPAAIANPGNGYSIYHNINSCTFNNLGISLVYGSYCQGMTVSQINSQNTGIGVYCPPGSTGLLAQLQVSSSQFANTQNCIALQSAILNTMIYGNNIISINGNSGLYCPITDGISVSANQFISGDANSNFGVTLGPPGGTGHHSAVVTGNSFIGLNTGVFLQSGSNNCNVQSNSYYACVTNVANGGTGNIVGGGST